ncbi:type II toxin-antitoxin system prevent-host-death family antitoxin [Mesorhizobium sp. M0898]
MSELVSRAEAGEEIVITRYGKVAARLVPPAVPESLPRIGAMNGKIRIADDFDELGPEWDGYAK